ncbi:hypothetical protein BH10ACI3_BH10ACI3_23800 [soil metagenome]
MKNNTFRYLIACFALAGLAIVFACQKGQQIEYKKYASDAEVPRISVEDAKKEVDAGTAIIVDSRADSAYKQEHIAGSINYPLGSPEDKFSTLPKGKKLILYCS